MSKDAQSIGRDLARVWSAIDDVKADAKNAKKAGGSAMEKFIALKQAEDMEQNLIQIIRATRGEKGLRQFMALRKEEKKAMEASAIEARKRLRKWADILTYTIGFLIFIGGTALLIYIAYLVREGQL
tara:strand:- start:1037 stop:1417 length:381 start_codon:yes stop_codon:yes gene_type:complete